MRLILSEPGDSAARWIHEELVERGIATELVTSEALCLGAVWSHRLGREGAGFEVALADDRSLNSDRIRWVLNRLVRIPEAYLITAQEGDRLYAEPEWRALLCSALASLKFRGVKVVDCPNPYSLTGKWRSPAEWSLLAARAGLPVAPWRWHELVPEPSPVTGKVTGVLVVGESVLSPEPLPTGLSNACRRLAELAESSCLQVGFAFNGSDGAMFCGAQTIIDPRIGGGRALDALLTVLGE